MSETLTILKNQIHGLTQKLGYQIRKVREETPTHETVLPLATYSPWKTDSAFLDVYGRIKKNTLVDKYRCYELWSLVEQTSKLNGCLIEVGVWRGGTGTLLAKKADLCRIKDTVFLCDTFSGVVNASDKDTAYKGGEHCDTTRGTVESLLQSFGLANVRILEGIFPNETAAAVEGNIFRLCHIDVDVYQSAKDTLQWIWSRLVIGGVVVFDDYGSRGCEGITTCVQEQMSLPDRIIFQNLNGHAIVVKIK